MRSLFNITKFFHAQRRTDCEYVRKQIFAGYAFFFE